MQPDPALSASALAREARTALTVAHGRLQLLRRKVGRGEVDEAALLGELDDACLRIRRLVALVDALESGAAVLPLLAARRTDAAHPAD